MDSKPDIQVAISQAELANIVPPGAMQEIDPTFNETLAQIEADKKKKIVEQQAELAKLTAKTAPKTVPIELKYTFVGTCPNCGQLVKTLTVDNEAGYFAICYCFSCDKQLESRKVVKLESPKPPEVNKKK